MLPGRLPPSNTKSLRWPHSGKLSHEICVDRHYLWIAERVSHNPATALWASEKPARASRARCWPPVDAAIAHVRGAVLFAGNNLRQRMWADVGPACALATNSRVSPGRAFGRPNSGATRCAARPRHRYGPVGRRADGAERRGPNLRIGEVSYPRDGLHRDASIMVARA